MQKYSMTFIPIITILLALFILGSVSGNQERQSIMIENPHRTFKVGWNNLYPYQYSKDIHGHGTLFGLDANGQLDVGLNAIKLPPYLLTEP